LWDEVLEVAAAAEDEVAAESPVVVMEIERLDRTREAEGTVQASVFAGTFMSRSTLTNDKVLMVLILAIISTEAKQVASDDN
jgi:hypothetical protein